jgi:hypothetical protein
VRRIVVLKLDCHVGETSLAPDKVENRRTEQSIELPAMSGYRKVHAEPMISFAPMEMTIFP